MTTNIKVAQNVSSDGAIITGFRYVDTNLTLGDEGTGSSPGVHGIVSLATSGAAAMAPTITLYVG